MSELATWGLILGMMAVTFLPRYLPYALAHRVKLPPLLVSALEYVPIAVLTAIIVQVTLVRDGAINFGPANPHLLAALAAAITAAISRHLFLTISVGLGVYVLARWLV